MTRKECLDKAAECVLQDRNREYGEPERSFHYIADLWSAYLRTKIEPYDAAAMMALFKLARLRFNPYYEDGWADLAGYAACGAELAGAEKAREDATRRWGEEYKKLRVKAEGDAKAKGCEGCGYKEGDKVLVTMPEGEDVPCVYVGESTHPGCCCVRYLSGDNRGDTDDTVPIDQLRRVPVSKAEGCEELEFKPGDAVEWNGVGQNWLPAVFQREFGDFGHCVVRLPDGRERIVSKVDLRRPEANHPENPDSSTEAKPRFKHGDKVQCRVTLPSVSDRIWVDGDYVRYEKGRSRPHVVFTRAALELVGDEDIRPAPEAEGCEELVQDEESDVERVFGTLKKRPAPEYDAPQTPRELYDRIVANNPATFKARTPTGEELAEMAEEEPHG